MCSVQVLVILVILMAISTSSSLVAALNKGFVAKLIHKTSVVSPFYSSNATTRLLQKHSIAVSAARNRHFFTQKTMAPPFNHDFVMLFSLGSPPANAFGIPDTAADLIWLRCVRCDTCLDPSAPFYDPHVSFTHHYIHCGTPSCGLVPHGSCSVDGFCTYAAFYPDESYSMGEVVSDYSFYYKSRNSTTMVNHLLFGCGTHNFDSGGQGLPGVVGLRMGSNISLLGQLSDPPSFSYCQNAAQVGGYIRFGSESILQQGDSTPLLPNAYGSYHLTLEGISVDGKQVEFSGEFFRMEQGTTETGFIIDTGTTYTILYKEAYDQLLSTMKNTNAMRDRKAYQDPIWDLCFDDISGAPEIELLFTGFDFPLSDENLWVEGPGGLYCLAMQPTLNRLSVLGMYQQRSINVGFDLVNLQMWFQYQSNCPE